MSENRIEPALDPCGCCETGREDVELYNPPGLSALDYRIGVHPSFLRRMLDALRSQTVPPDDPNDATDSETVPP